jgi:hypothetical protein
MFTSLSSVNLLLGTLQYCGSRQTNMRVASCTLFIVVSAVVGELLKIPFTAEVLYIGVTATAAAFGGTVLLLLPLLKWRGGGAASRRAANNLAGLVISAIGAGIFVVSPLLDRVFCECLPPGIGPYFAALPVAFFGCDIGFVGLLIFLLQSTAPKHSRLE